MLKEVLLGKIGLTMEAGIIVNWLKKEGDYVEKGDPLFEVETDKATQIIESFHSGYLKKILIPKGREVPVRTVIAFIGEKDDVVPEKPAGGVEKKPEGQFMESVSAGNAQRAAVHDKLLKGRINASPLAKRLAAELGIDLSGIKGSGPDGRIGKEDVLAATVAAKAMDDEIKPEEPGAHKAIKVKPGESIGVMAEKKLIGIQRVVAERMKASWVDAPHIHLELWVDMTEASVVRNRMNEDSSVKVHLTYTDILASSAAKTLRKNMGLNAKLRNDSIIIFEEINIGIAVSTEKGLVVPVIKHADELTLQELSVCRQDLVSRTKSGKQTLADLSGGTFTITNLGMYGIVSFKPIINTGQAAILAMGKIMNTPVADGSGNITVKPLVNLSLACDHRIVDGADGAKFLSDLKELLENPAGIAG